MNPWVSWKMAKYLKGNDPIGGTHFLTSMIVGGSVLQSMLSGLPEEGTGSVSSIHLPKAPHLCPRRSKAAFRSEGQITDLERS